MPFSKGDVNINRAGRPPKGKSFPDVLSKILNENAEIANMPEMDKKEALMRKLVQHAFKGEAWAVNAVMERMEGKAVAAMDITSNGESITEVKQTIVSPGNTNS